jgi:predicted MFS family arabinose efflux permease
VVALAVGLAFADASIVALALPDLYLDFETSIPQVSWVLTSYALAVVLAGLGTLALVRRARASVVAAGGAITFAVASTLAGAAPTLPVLVVARILQGAGAAALVAGSFGVLVALLGDRRRAGRWWATAATVGAAVGPALGGVVTETLSWRAVFVVQAPVAALAAVAALSSGARRERLTPHEGRRPHRAVVADVALALTFAALVGALFLGVLLLVVVWGLSPVTAAVVVSALPAGTLLASRLVHPMRERRAALAGGILLAGGLATLALLPAVHVIWTASALGLCGTGFGLLVGVLGPLALPATSGIRAATLTSSARHLGLVLGLAIIAPVLSADLLAAADRAPLPATQAMLDAPVGGVTKVRLALDIRDELDASSSEMPDLDAVFRRHGADDDEQVAALQHTVETGIQAVLTRAFRASFAIAAGFALVAGLVGWAAFLRRGPPTHHHHDPHRHRRRRVPLLAAAIVVGVAVPASAVQAGAGGFGAVALDDPCAAPADPFPGGGLDAAAQRAVLSGLNGAACELGVTREELVLSLEPRSGVEVRWDRDTIEDALRSGVDRAIADADDRGTVPGLIAGPLRWIVARAPISWFLEQLGVR